MACDMPQLRSSADERTAIVAEKIVELAQAGETEYAFAGGGASEAHSLAPADRILYPAVPNCGESGTLIDLPLAVQMQRFQRRLWSRSLRVGSDSLYRVHALQIGVALSAPRTVCAPGSSANGSPATCRAFPLDLFRSSAYSRERMR